MNNLVDQHAVVYDRMRKDGMPDSECINDSPDDGGFHGFDVVKKSGPDFNVGAYLQLLCNGIARIAPVVLGFLEIVPEPVGAFCFLTRRVDHRVHKVISLAPN